MKPIKQSHGKIQYRRSILTEEQKAEVDRRLADHKNGIGRTYTLDEAMSFLDKSIISSKRTSK